MYLQAFKTQNLVCFGKFFAPQAYQTKHSRERLKHSTLIKFFRSIPNFECFVNRRIAAPTPPLARSILFPFDPLEVGRLPNQFFSPPLAYFVLLGGFHEFSLQIDSISSFRSRNMTWSSEVQQRRPHRYLSVHKRYLEGYCLSSNEQVRARRIRKAAMLYIHIHTYTYMYIHTYIHTYTYIYIHIHTYTVIPEKERDI